MATQSEVLTLVAQVQNRFSEPIREMTRSLRTMMEHGNAAHREGRRAVVEHKKSFLALKKTLKESSENAKQLLEPALVGLGLRAISTGAAIAKVTEAIRSFAGTARDLKFFTAETGLAVNALRQFEAAGERVGIASSAMDEQIKGFAESLRNIQSATGPRGPFVGALSGNPSLLPLRELLLSAKGTEDALVKVRKFLEDKDERTKHVVTEALRLDPKWARISEGLLADVGKNIGKLTDKQVADGVRLQEAFDALKEKATGLKDSIGAELASAMTEMTEGHLEK